METLIKGRAHAPVGGQRNKGGFRKPCQESPDPGNTVVGAAVVHNYQLNVRVRLARHGKESFPYEAALVVADAYNCHQRQELGNVRGTVGRELQKGERKKSRTKEAFRPAGLQLVYMGSDVLLAAVFQPFVGFGVGW